MNGNWLRAWGALGCVSLLSACAVEPVSDTTLIEQFQRNRDGFERMKDLCEAEPEIALVEDGRLMVATAPGFVKDAREGEIRDLMRTLGIRRVMRLGGGQALGPVGGTTLWFAAFDDRTPTRRVAKGYLYSVNEGAALGQVVPELDSRSASDRSRGNAARKIDGRWYLAIRYG